MEDYYDKISETKSRIESKEKKLTRVNEDIKYLTEDWVKIQKEILFLQSMLEIFENDK